MTLLQTRRRSASTVQPAWNVQSWKVDRANAYVGGWLPVSAAHRMLETINGRGYGTYINIEDGGAFVESCVTAAVAAKVLAATRDMGIRTTTH